MSLEIRKYALSAMVSEPSRQDVLMPTGSEILSIQFQHGAIAIWAAIDPTASTEIRTFALIKTGRPLDGIDVNRYIGTIQTHGGSPVWHIFEV